MDTYSRYLRDMQTKYFEDVILKAEPKAKITVKDTYWEHQQTLPFHIMASVELGKNEKYDAIMEYRAWSVKGIDTQYGMFVIDMYSENNDSHFQIYVNPATLRSSYNLPEEDEDEFFKELAYWAEDFTSERYISPKDGSTIPELIDVILTYAQNRGEKTSTN